MRSALFIASAAGPEMTPPSSAYPGAITKAWKASAGWRSAMSATARSAWSSHMARSASQSKLGSGISPRHAPSSLYNVVMAAAIVGHDDAGLAQEIWRSRTGSSNGSPPRVLRSLFVDILGPSKEWLDKRSADFTSKIQKELVRRERKPKALNNEKVALQPRVQAGDQAAIDRAAEIDEEYKQTLAEPLPDEILGDVKKPLNELIADFVGHPLDERFQPLPDAGAEQPPTNVPPRGARWHGHSAGARRDALMRASTGLCCGLLGLAGCSSSEREGAPADSAAPVHSSSERPEASAAPSPPVPRATSDETSAHPVASSAAPPWNPRPRPTLEEWKAAATRTRAGSCRADGLGDWVRLSCRDGYWSSRAGDWGKASVDYFEGLGATMDLRLRPGMLASAMHRDSGLRVVFVWPSGFAEPIVSMKEKTATPEPLPAPQPIPTVPTVDQPKPIEADWYVATPVNTASKSAGQQCSIVVQGQWARMQCACELAFIARWKTFEDFGSESDVLREQLSTPTDLVRITFRLKRGGSGRAEVELGLK